MLLIISYVGLLPALKKPAPRELERLREIIIIIIIIISVIINVLEKVTAENLRDECIDAWGLVTPIDLQFIAV